MRVENQANQTTIMFFQMTPSLKNLMLPPAARLFSSRAFLSL